MKTQSNVAGGWVRRQAKLTAYRAVALLVLLVAATLAVWAAPLPFLPTVILQLCALVAISAVERRFVPIVERRARGAGAEERVGALLDGLDGWQVIHDVDLGRGNVDHVVVGPGGVFTVETKSWKGYFDPDRADPRWWRQAYAQSKAIGELVGQKVEPLLVVEGARTKRALERRRGVLVMSDRLLVGHLERRSGVLTADASIELVDRLVSALRTR